LLQNAWLKIKIEFFKSQGPIQNELYSFVGIRPGANGADTKKIQNLPAGSRNTRTGSGPEQEVGGSRASVESGAYDGRAR
jgi:hypothetical protein